MWIAPYRFLARVPQHERHSLFCGKEMHKNNANVWQIMNVTIVKPTLAV